MKPKTPKPRVMWAAEICGEIEGVYHRKAMAYYGDVRYRVAVIPLVDLDNLVVKCVGAYWTGENKRPDLSRGEAMRLALTAAGTPCKQRRARK